MLLSAHFKPILLFIDGNLRFVGTERPGLALLIHEELSGGGLRKQNGES
jgi:hypothetical protein